MNYTIQEYYHETIQTYQEEHLTEDYRAIQVIQILAPDLSCIDCYPPRRTSRRQPFGRFWNWYQRTYNSLTFSSRTQDLFWLLSQVHNSTTARTICRDLIFSCTYRDHNYDPREIISQIFARYTTFNIPTLDPQYYNQYDYYLESEHYPHWQDPFRDSTYSEPGSPQTLVDLPLTFEDLATPPSPPPLNLPPPINFLPPPLPPLQPQMGDQALRAAATAMTDLANALEQGTEKSLIWVEYFLGDGTQDPEQWFEEFRRAAAANKWSNAWKLELAPVYLKGVAQDWYSALHPASNTFDDATHQE